MMNLEAYLFIISNVKKRVDVESFNLAWQHIMKSIIKNLIFSLICGWASKLCRFRRIEPGSSSRWIKWFNKELLYSITEARWHCNSVLTNEGFWDLTLLTFLLICAKYAKFGRLEPEVLCCFLNWELDDLIMLNLICGVRAVNMLTKWKEWLQKLKKGNWI